MRQTIQEREAEVYADLWSSVALYKSNSPGERYAEVFHSIVQDPGATVLDAGCGEGRGMVELAKLGYQVAGIDITDAGLSAEAKQYPCVIETIWADLRPALLVLRLTVPTVFTSDTVDYVYCCDVLEHLEPQFTMLAVDQLLRVAKKGVFLSIYFDQDRFGHWVGRPLHLTVQPFVWWRDALREIADVVEARDCHNFGIFYLRTA
jgi:SAM-dependent methyltransferase